MEPQQPLGQPVNPNPGDAEYVPQPLGGNAPKKSNKKMWIIIAGVFGLLLLLGTLYTVMSKSAAESYKKDAATYKEELKDARDAMNTVLDEQNISIRGPKAPPIFEEYGKKIQGVTAGAPKQPKVFGLIAASATNETKDQIDALTTAANNYAGELRRIYTLFTYFTATAEKFKPIKDLGAFTVKDKEKIKTLPDLWETFLVEFKAVPAPAGLESLSEEIIRQAEALLAEFKTLASGFDGRTETQNDEIVKNLKAPAAALNETFQNSVQDSTNEAIDKVNTYYDELDKLLQ